MPRTAVNTAAGVRTKVPTPGSSASFVAGSRPGTQRAAPVPRVTPQLRQRDYGKSDPAPSGFGLTGLTSRS